MIAFMQLISALLSALLCVLIPAVLLKKGIDAFFTTKH